MQEPVSVDGEVDGMRVGDHVGNYAVGNIVGKSYVGDAVGLLNTNDNVDFNFITIKKTERFSKLANKRVLNAKMVESSKISCAIFHGVPPPSKRFINLANYSLDRTCMMILFLQLLLLFLLSLYDELTAE